MAKEERCPSGAKEKGRWATSKAPGVSSSPSHGGAQKFVNCCNKAASRLSFLLIIRSGDGEMIEHVNCPHGDHRYSPLWPDHKMLKTPGEADVAIETKLCPWSGREHT